MDKTLKIINDYFNIILETYKISDLKKELYDETSNKYNELTIKDFLVLYKIEEIYNKALSSNLEYKDKAKGETLKAMYLSYTRLNKKINEELVKEIKSNNTYHSITKKRLEEIRDGMEVILRNNNIIPLDMKFENIINILSEEEKKKIK